jgi:hypothetical protein
MTIVRATATPSPAQFTLLSSGEEGGDSDKACPIEFVRHAAANRTLHGVVFDILGMRAA